MTPKYKGQRKGGYGSQRSRSSFRGRGKGFQRNREETRLARENFESRSKRSQVQDLIKLAPIAPSLQAYLASPNKFDFPSVDLPDARLIFSHKTPRQQAQDIARIAKKQPLELWIKDTSRADIANVDTPPSKNTKKPTVIPAKTRKYKVAEKAKAKKELEKAEKKEEQTLKSKQPKKEKKKTEGRKLPTKAEIIERATEMHLEDQARQGLPTITPEESELKESGLFKEAQNELMRGIDSIVDPQVEKYIHELKDELEPHGYNIVPMGG